MARYAEAADVQQHVPTQLVTIGASSQPSTSSVEEWLDAQSAWIDSTLRWVSALLGESGDTGGVRGASRCDRSGRR